jgi:UDP-N-acetylglucosamine--N-acetylmuramyl-(pentapeptide) pyrophosphoryl-undecaprenol N-acetylglucosamine transferase
VSTFVLSAGGTGGHLSPGIALAEGLRGRGHDVVLLISRKQVDARLSGQYPHLQFIALPGAGFAWRPDRLLRCGATQVQAGWATLRLLRARPPRAVLGFGGFTSAPLVVAAALLGVPAALHESNRVPGLAVRLLGRLARRVYLPPGVALPAVRAAAIRHVGAPVRREIRPRPPAEARAVFGLAPDRPLVVVLGGSQGAAPLNAWARAQAADFAAAGVQLAVVTGPGTGAEEAVAPPTAAGVPARALYLPFCDRMADLLSAADLVVSRAGAGTIAELIRCATPAILVPYPQAADNHQAANADWFAQQGGGLVVPQDQLAGLRAAVDGLLGDPARRQRLRGALQGLDRANALEFILDDLEGLAARPAAGAPGLGMAVA